jgi:thiosulfate reductase/polysulfide reductase chain A
MAHAATGDAAGDGDRPSPPSARCASGAAAASRSLRDGKLWKFEGNPRDPQSNGRLCPRGTGAVGAHYDPDRLRQPLMRVGERGKEQWKAVELGRGARLRRRDA